SHQWLARHRERFQQRTGIRWAIVPNVEHNQSTQSIGTIGLTITSNDDRIAEFGIVVARAWWRKGLGTTAARMVVRYGSTCSVSPKFARSFLRPTSPRSDC
ncbi:MAG: GNAT family N-acetyltransferase, partial [Casimicrobium sp.]